MSNPFPSSIAAIDFFDNPSPIDLSGNGGPVINSARGNIAFTAINPLNSAVAGWFQFPNAMPSANINTLLFCGTIDSSFSTNNSVWVYVFSGKTAITSITYRSGGTVLTFSIASTNFSTWQHVAFNNTGGSVQGYLNGVSIGTLGTIVNPDIRAIGINTEGSLRGNVHGAGVGVWDRVLTSGELAWLADADNRPGPSSGGFPLSRLVN